MFLPRVRGEKYVPKESARRLPIKSPSPKRSPHPIEKGAFEIKDSAPSTERAKSMIEKEQSVYNQIPHDYRDQVATSTEMRRNKQQRGYNLNSSTGVTSYDKMAISSGHQSIQSVHHQRFDSLTGSSNPHIIGGKPAQFLKPSRNLSQGIIVQQKSDIDLRLNFSTLDSEKPITPSKYLEPKISKISRSKNPPVLNKAKKKYLTLLKKLEEARSDPNNVLS